MTEYDIELLKELVGLPNEITGWGAAMSLSIEYLRENGYVFGSFYIVITEKGKDCLRELGYEI